MPRADKPLFREQLECNEGSKVRCILTTMPRKKSLFYLYLEDFNSEAATSNRISI